MSVLDMAQKYDGEALFLELLEKREYPFIAIATVSTLTRIGRKWLGPIYVSKRALLHLNWEQTYDMLNWIVKIWMFGHLRKC